MKILKYIFLLLLLLIIGATIFVGTQKSNFSIVKSKIINSPKAVVYNYVNDYKNWENWYVWEKDSTNVKLFFTKKTSGIGAAYSWSDSDGNGTSKTIFVKENDSIAQNSNLEGAISELSWKFKDTIGGTKVTYSIKGEMPFMFKIHAFLNGGIEKIIGERCEKSLSNLDKSLDYELNTFSIKVNGIVTKKGGFYLKQTINSKISNLSKNVKIMIPNLIAFCKENNLVISGKPFILYNTYTIASGITNFSVCIPIKNQIFTSTGSDIICSELQPYQAVKTTLIGDYSHSETAWKKTSEYISKNNINADKSIPNMEVYLKGPDEQKHPSKWVTSFYIAIVSKNSAKPVLKVEEKTSTNNLEVNLN